MAKKKYSPSITELLTAIALVLISITLYLVVNASKSATNSDARADNPCNDTKVADTGALVGTVSGSLVDRFDLVVSGGLTKPIKKCLDVKIFTDSDDKQQHRLPMEMIADGMSLTIHGEYIDTTSTTVAAKKIVIANSKSYMLGKSKTRGLEGDFVKVDLRDGPSGLLSLTGLSCWSQNKQGGDFETLNCRTDTDGREIGSRTSEALLWNGRLYGVTDLYLK